MDVNAFLASFISIMYVLMFVLVSFQLVRIVVFRHKLYSFQVGFLVLCFIWLACRVVFWFFLDIDGNAAWLVTLVYLFPSVCQIATFSLLILFYAKLVHRHRWAQYKAGFITCYVMSVSIMILLTVLFAGLYHINVTSSDDTDESVKLLDEMYYFASGTYFGALVVLASWHVYRLRLQSHPATRSSRRVVVATSLVFVVFLTRCVFDFFAAFGSSTLHVKHDHQNKYIEPLTFALLILWEVFPTGMIVIYFWNIPTTRVGRCVMLANCIRCRCFQISPSSPTLTSEEDYSTPIVRRSSQTGPSSDSSRPSHSRLPSISHTDHETSSVSVTSNSSTGLRPQSVVFDDPSRYDSDGEIGPSSNSMPAQAPALHPWQAPQHQHHQNQIISNKPYQAMSSNSTMGGQYRFNPYPQQYVTYPSEHDGGEMDGEDSPPAPPHLPTAVHHAYMPIHAQPANLHLYQQAQYQQAPHYTAHLQQTLQYASGRGGENRGYVPPGVGPSKTRS